MISSLRRFWCRIWHRNRGFWVEEVVRFREGIQFFSTCSKCGRDFYDERGYDHG